MADDAVSGAACNNPACQNVADRDILFSKATMANLQTACGPKPAAMQSCETGIPTTEELCEANGVSYPQATTKCGKTPCQDVPVGFLIDECVYDVCAGGGEAVIESYRMEASDLCNGDEGLPVFPSPPPPSASPSPPPPSPSPSPSPPAESETFDDPHISTLSGERYFMHGVGVFEYASSGEVTSQVYMCPFAPCTEPMMGRGECLTFISAVAIRTAEHIVILRGSSLNLDDCDQAGQTDDQWLWHNCTKMGWSVTTKELTIDMGVIGPYEEGWLKEGVSDRTFNLEVTGVKNQKLVRGII